MSENIDPTVEPCASDVAALLLSTATSLRNPRTWTQLAEGRDAYHQEVPPDSPKAVCRCALGWLKYHKSRLHLSTEALMEAQKRMRLQMPRFGCGKALLEQYPPLIAIWTISIPAMNDSSWMNGRKVLQLAAQEAAKELLVHG